MFFIYTNISTSVKIAVSILVIVTFITYFNILPNQLFFDDEELIYKNEFVKDFRYLPKYFTTNMIAGAEKMSNMYRPVLTTSFAIDYLFWKNNSLGYHLTSIFLHTANSILIFFLINKLFHHRILSFLTSLLFIIHPVNSEAVIYASGRTDPLYTLFSLLSVLFFLNKKKSVFCFLFSVLFFILAILSKESAVILPLLIIITFCIYSQQRKIKISYLKLICLISPFILIDFFYIFLRLTVLNFQNTLNFYPQQNIYSQNLFIRIATFLSVLWDYLLLLVFPKDLMIARNPEVIISLLNINVIAALILIFGLFLSSFYLWRKKVVLPLFSLFWFFICLIPAMGIIPINNIAAEHYLYLPSIGFFLLMSFTVKWFWQKYSSINYRTMIIFFFIIILLSLMTRTIIRTFDWRDPITFYTVSLKQSPWNIPIRNNLAMAYDEKGETVKAIAEYEYIISQSDTYPQVRHNLGNAYQKLDEYQRAESSYKKALEIDPSFHFSKKALEELYRKRGENKK